MKRTILALSLLFLLGLMATAVLEWPAIDDPATPDPNQWFRKANSRFNFTYKSKTIDDPGPLAPDYIDNNGVFSADVNNDRWPDLFVTGGEQPKLYINRKGRLHERNSFPQIDRKVSAAAFGDFNSDGWKDLVIVPQEGQVEILKNNGGEFVKQTVLSAPSLNSGAGVTVGDLNQNGCADIFVLQYSTGGKEPDAPLRHKLYRLGDPKTTHPRDDTGEPNYLLLGNCNGGFTVSKEEAFQRKHFSLAASTADFTGNGLLDIHVANDFYWDSLYLNRGEGHFRHTYLPSTTDRNGMSSAVSDLNNDGLPDLFVSNIHVPDNSSIYRLENFRFLVTSTMEGHNLLVNKGDGDFRDVATKAGVNPPGWGWDAVFTDFDNNGDRELFQCQQDYLRSGRKMRVFDLKNHDLASLLKQETSSKKAFSGSLREYKFYDELKYWMGFPSIYRRKGGKATYNHHLLKNFRAGCRGNLAVDFNRTGNRDLVLSTYQGEYFFLENVTGRNNNWLKIHLEDPRYSGGGTVELNFGDERRVYPLTSGTGFKSQQPAIFHQGTGSVDTVEKLEINWNTGGTQTIRNLKLPAKLVADRQGLRRLKQ